MMIGCVRNWEMLDIVGCRILTWPISEKLHHWVRLFFQNGLWQGITNKWVDFSLSINDHNVQWLHTLYFTLLVFSPVHAQISSGQQDIVMLSDRQIRSCYSILRQRGMKIAWQWSSTCSTVTLRVHKRWLTPSLKQSRNKLDMTSVTPAIITGQDSWPLPVMVHVAIRRNTTHWLHAEPRSKTCFIMLSIGRDFSVAANWLLCVFFPSRRQKYVMC